VHSAPRERAKTSWARPHIPAYSCDVSTVVLVRHGRTAANATGVLAGWSPGVFLDDEGEAQVERVAQAISSVELNALITSPLDRTQQTAEAILAGQRASGYQPGFHVEPRVGECHYGEWTGRPLEELSSDPLWAAVQAHPSSVTFPGNAGESMAQMQLRATSAIREWNATLGPDALYCVVSHGDVIKAILADALGMHLDHFQRIQVDPASISIVHYSSLRPFVVRTNGSPDSLSGLAAQMDARRKAGSSDAPVGGGSGS
jgi:probable phosphomutase (TIGR03848 family)